MSFFGADINSSGHVGNKNKDILILGEGTTQGLDDATLKAGGKYPINFAQSTKISKELTINNMKKKKQD